MRDEKENEQTNSIEEKARQLLGYDRESLTREMDQAEQEWESRKQKDPTLEARTKKEAEDSFQKLMNRIRKENAGDSPGDLQLEYRSNVVEDSRRTLRLKGYGKILLVAAVLMALVLGMGISAVANKKFALKKMDSSLVKNEIQWSDNEYIFETDSLEKSYANIQEIIKVKPIKLNYIPTGMAFYELMIDGNRATLVFFHGNKYIYVTQAKLEANKVSEGVVSDRILEKTVTNIRLNHDFIINENVLSEGVIEYSTAWETEDAFYQVFGIVEKEDFVKMIADLEFYK